MGLRRSRAFSTVVIFTFLIGALVSPPVAEAGWRRVGKRAAGKVRRARKRSLPRPRIAPLALAVGLALALPACVQTPGGVRSDNAFDVIGSAMERTAADIQKQMGGGSASAGHVDKRAGKTAGGDERKAGGAPVPRYVANGWTEPLVAGGYVRSKFSWARLDPKPKKGEKRKKKLHAGDDVVSNTSRAVTLPKGRVVYGGPTDSGYGNMVVSAHATERRDGGYDVWFGRGGHYASVYVTSGQWLVTGTETVGKMGRTGKATGVNLHQEVIHLDPVRQPEDVKLVLRFLAGDPEARLHYKDFKAIKNRATKGGRGWDRRPFAYLQSLTNLPPGPSAIARGRSSSDSS